MVSEGYKSQAPIYTKALIATFAAGLVIGTLIGWGAANSRNETPTDVAPVAENTPDAEQNPPATDTPEPPIAPPATPTPAPVETPTAETEPVTTEAPTAPGPPFQPDVDGLWPAEHLIVGINGTTADVQTQELLNEFKPGGVVLRPDNVTDTLQLATLVLQIKKAVGIGTTIADPPTIYYQDSESDLPRILENAASVQLAGLADATAIEAAAAQAIEGQKQGIAVVLGPTMELASAAAPLPADMDKEALEKRAGEVIQTALAYVGRLQSAGMLTAPGIFPGERISTGEPQARQIPAGQMDRLAAAMQPFKAAIDAGIPGLLVGHVAVPGIDVEQPNRPASISPKLLQLLLRNDWGFKGVVIASDITGDPMVRDVPRDEMTLKALVTGCDAVILQNATRADLKLICDTFVRLSKRSDFPMAQIETSKSRLDTWRMMLAQSPQSSPVQVADASATPNNEPANTPETATTTEAPEQPKVDIAPPAPSSSETVAPAPEADPAPAETPAMTEPESKVEAPAAEIAPPAAPEKIDNESEKTTEPTAESDTKPEPADTPAAVEPPAAEATEKPAVENTEAPTANQDAPAPADAKPADVESTESPATEEKTAEVDAEISKPESTEPDAPKVPEGATLVEHTIAKGESLTFIAKKYGVALTDLRAWNELEDDNIKYGRTLKIYTTGAPAGDDSEKKETAEETTPESTTASETPEADGAPEEATRVDEAADTVEVMDATATTPPPAESDPGAAAPTLEASEPQEEPVAAPAPMATPPAGAEKRQHTILAGETLESIANEYGVTIAELLEWNERTPDQLTIQSGSELTVYLPVAEDSTEPQEAAATASENTAKPKPAPAPGSFEVYEVKSGDNLRRIAARFGTTQKAIMEMNDLKSADHVEIGWKLKIPKAADAKQTAPASESDSAAPETTTAPPEGEAENTESN